MKLVLVALIAGTLVSGVAAGYAATSQRLDRPAAEARAAR